jgi:ribosomal protein S18 acetylase RimI-like enzyme
MEPGHNEPVTVAGPGSQNNPVSLRTGTTADAVSVLDLWVAAGAHPTSTDDPSSLAALVARDPEALLIAEIEGRVVGTLIATWDGWRGSMYRLAVLPDFRRRGIAGMLVGHGERRLLSLGCRRVQALVVDADARACAFWTGVDYIPDSLRRYVHAL